MNHRLIFHHHSLTIHKYFPKKMNLIIPLTTAFDFRESLPRSAIWSSFPTATKSCIVFWTFTAFSPISLILNQNSLFLRIRHERSRKLFANLNIFHEQELNKNIKTVRRLNFEIIFASIECVWSTYSYDTMNWKLVNPRSSRTVHLDVATFKQTRRTDKFWITLQSKSDLIWLYLSIPPSLYYIRIQFTSSKIRFETIWFFQISIPVCVVEFHHGDFYSYRSVWECFDLSHNLLQEKLGCRPFPLAYFYLSELNKHAEILSIS